MVVDAETRPGTYSRWLIAIRISAAGVRLGASAAALEPAAQERPRCRLPEIGGPALERLVGLDREAKLISRDVVMIDLRLPDRVTVQLSPAAAQARADAIKKEKPAAKGGKA
jgi:hypothetical protein